MNASTPEFGHNSLPDPQRHPQKSASTTTAQFRNFARQLASPILISLSPQASVKECLLRGTPVTCQGRITEKGERRSFPVHLKRADDGGLICESPEWPTGIQLVYLLAGKFLFPKFTPKRQCFSTASPPTPAQSPSPRKAESPAWSMQLAAASGEEDDVPDEVALDWKGGRFLRVEVVLDDHDGDAWVVVEMEWKDTHGKDQRIVKPLRIVERSAGFWSGKLRLHRPPTSFDGKVWIKVTPITAEDLDRLDDNFGDSGELPSTTAYLAKKSYATKLLRRDGESFRTDPLTRAFVDPNVSFAFGGIPEMEVPQEDSPFPSDEDSLLRYRQEMRKILVSSNPWQLGDASSSGAEHARIDNEIVASVWQTLDASSSRAGQSDDAERAARDSRVRALFWEGWSAVAPLLLGYLLSVIRRKEGRKNDVHYAHDLLEKTCEKVRNKLPLTNYISDLQAWLKTVAYHVWLEEVRRRGRGNGGSFADWQGGGGPAEGGIDDTGDGETSLGGSRADADRALGATYLDRLSERERDCWLARYPGNGNQDLTIDEVAGALGWTNNQVILALESARWKLKICDALDFLRDRFAERERRLLDLSEVSLRKVADIEDELNMSAAERKSAMVRLLPQLEAAIAMRALMLGGRLAEEDRMLLLNWLFATDPVARAANGSGQSHFQRVGRRLHAQILLETDHRRRPPMIKLGQLGKLWVEWIVISKGPRSELEHRLLEYQKFTDPKGAFQGQHWRLRQHVRKVWEVTPTLVPPAYRTWVWDEPGLQPPESHGRE